MDWRSLLLGLLSGMFITHGLPFLFRLFSSLFSPRPPTAPKRDDSTTSGR